MARETGNVKLIREALAKVRKAKKGPDGKLKNRELANRVIQMLRHLRAARRGVIEGQYELAEYQAQQIVSGKYK